MVMIIIVMIYKDNLQIMIIISFLVDDNDDNLQIIYICNETDNVVKMMMIRTMGIPIMMIMTSIMTI